MLRKYGRGTIQEATHVNLIVPNTTRTRTWKTKSGETQKKSIVTSFITMDMSPSSL